MKNKDYVIDKMPNAKAERQVQGRIKGLQRVYWLIRDGRNTMYFAEGETEAKAWKSAKERIVSLESEGS